MAAGKEKDGCDWEGGVGGSPKAHLVGFLKIWVVSLWVSLLFIYLFFYFWSLFYYYNLNNIYIYPRYYILQ